MASARGGVPADPRDVGAARALATAVDRRPPSARGAARRGRGGARRPPGGAARDPAGVERRRRPRGAAPAAASGPSWTGGCGCATWRTGPWATPTPRVRRPADAVHDHRRGGPPAAADRAALLGAAHRRDRAQARLRVGVHPGRAARRRHGARRPGRLAAAHLPPRDAWVLVPMAVGRRRAAVGPQRQLRAVLGLPDPADHPAARPGRAQRRAAGRRPAGRHADRLRDRARVRLPAVAADLAGAAGRRAARRGAGAGPLRRRRVQREPGRDPPGPARAATGR